CDEPHNFFLTFCPIRGEAHVLKSKGSEKSVFRARNRSAMTLLLLLAALMLVLALVATGLRRVPAQRVAAVRRFGRYQRTLGPGWHWLSPLERKGASIELLNHHLHVDRGGLDAELYYQILDPEKAGETLERMDDFVAEEAR